MRSLRFPFLVAGLALAAPAVAQPTPPVAIVLEGDIVPGVGTITRIDNVAINANGLWLVEADTDFPDSTADSVLLRDGVLFLREGDPLGLPAGAALGSFDSVGINNNDDSGWNFFLDNLSTNEDSGIYYNATLVIQESDVSGAPEFTPGTPYIGFFDAKMNDVNVIMIIASIDDPNIPSSVDRAVVRALVSPAGNLMAESVLAKEGDVLPGQVEPVADFGTGPHQSSINDLGQILYFVDLAGPTSEDGAIYLDLTLLAQEGGPSPVAGRTYDFLSSRGLELNNVGSYVFKASLSGDTATDDLIVRNGAVFVREGDNLPAIGAFTFTSFGTGSGPVEIDDDGDVLWYGDWDDPDTDRDTGLFLNDRLIVQEGVTTIDGLVVDTISSGSDAFEMSDNGRWIIFEATLEDGTNGAFLIEVREGGGPNEPPVARCKNVTVEAGPDCLADASVDDGSFDPDGDPITLDQSPPGPYTVGATEVTLTVTDDKGLSDSCTATVTVVDVTPPQISVDLDPDEIWPPNHRLVDVNAMVAASDDCSVPEVVLTSASSSEPDNGEGDGDTVDDIQAADVGTADFELRLRAERSGTGDGRIYTVVYTATDSSGNQASASGLATVPHDQGGKTDPVEETVTETEDGTVVEWTEVPGAAYYNVVRGRLGELRETQGAILLGAVKCVKPQSTAADTTGWEDGQLPPSGDAFFYLVEYVGGYRSGLGTESAPKPRLAESGDCQ